MLNTKMTIINKKIKNTTTNKIYAHPGNKHRFKISKNIMKTIIANEITNWLAAPSREYFYSGSVDINSNRLYKHLTHTFKDFSWGITSSQSKFDIYSIDAGIIIELKSVKIKTKKLVFNASIYPDSVHVKNVFSKQSINNNPLLKKNINKLLDVLIVCVERTDDNIVYNHAIVDGSYWNITEQDYIDCNNLYADINRVKKAMFGVIANSTKNNLAKKIFNENFDGDFKLRKLITLSNPIGYV